MEATEAKTELVSPPQAHLPWGDNSPILGTNSPFEEVFFEKTPPPEASTDVHAEPKQISDGFLSEVSTPDNGRTPKKKPPSPRRHKEGDQSPFCISLQNSCTKDKNEERDVFDISPQKPLTGMSGMVSGRGELAEENVFYFSPSKVEEGVLQDPPNLVNVQQQMDAIKEEPQAKNENNCENPDARFTSDAPSRTEFGQNTATSLKRKYFLVTEGKLQRKLQRKRLKTNLPERSQAKGNAQWSYVSEEELKKLRRVKNRESVERCRTKQRLRMEALQVEQTCLRLENKNLQEATTSIRAALQDISVEMARLEDHMKSRDKEDRSAVEEFRREIHA